MATFNFNRNNLIAGTTYSALTSSATSLLVSFDTDTTSGNATASSSSDTLPDTPFFATLSPSGVIPNLLNSEIVLVTAKTWVSASSTWQFTITRAQRGTTARAFDAGSVFLGGVYTEDIDYTQAVGKGFFTASYGMGLFNISDSMLPTTPTDGMSIKVIFSQDVTSGTLGLSLNSGTAYNVYSGAAITSGAGSTTSTPLVKSGIIYDLVFYNGAWYAMNVPANNSITSDNVDWTTFGDWHNVRLVNGAKVANASYIHQNNRWRYTEGGRLIAIEFNVGFDTSVNAGTNSTPCWNGDDIPFITNGKFMRLVGTGVGSNIVELVFDTDSAIYFRPVTGASNYCAGAIVIPNPTFVE